MKYNWNSTTKTKKKIGGLYPTRYYYRFLWFFELLKVSAAIFCLKTVLTLNYVCSLILNILQWYYQKKTFYVQITMVLGDIDAKKTRKQTSHKIFPQGLIVNSSLL